MNPVKILLFLMLACIAGRATGAEPISLDAFEILEIRSERGPVPTRLDIHAFGRSFGLELSRNTSLLASLPGRQRSRIPAEDLFLKGSLSGIPGSWVRLNRIDGRFSGGFFDGKELYLIDRVAGFSGTRAAATPADRTIVFRFGDLDFPGLIDHGGIDPGGDRKPEAQGSGYASFVEHLREVVTLQGTAMFAVPVTVVSDVQFTARHGASAASVVAGRINFIDGIYSSQVGTGITLLHHEILSDNDVLTATDAADLLVGRFDAGNNLIQPGFRQFMRTGAGSSLPFQGLAHLFTGRNLDGSTVGIAYVGVLCSRSAGYGVDQDLNSETTSALVFAHEVGHNFNAPHDGEVGRACEDETFRGIMNPSINGSEQFSNCSLEQMAPEVAAASCLVEAIDSQAIFDDGFE